MARYINDVKTSKPAGAVKEVETYLQKEGFELIGTSTSNEVYWEKEIGMGCGPQFVKVEPGEKTIHLEAWVKFNIFPGIFILERGLTKSAWDYLSLGSFFGVNNIRAKRMLKYCIEAIESLIQK